jgi:hypothetical protein
VRTERSKLGTDEILTILNDKDMIAYTPTPTKVGVFGDTMMCSGLLRHKPDHGKTSSLTMFTICRGVSDKERMRLSQSFRRGDRFSLADCYEAKRWPERRGNTHEHDR